MAELKTNETVVVTGGVPTVESLELSVVRTNGVLDANFDELEKALNVILDKYRMVQYSDDADEKVKQLRKDRADLNKLTATIKERKKEVKEVFLAPWNDFDEGTKRLLNLIEEPKQVIDEKVKELEEAGREAKRVDIRNFYDSISAGVDADFRETLYKHLYNSSWENASSTQKAYKEGLQKGVDNYMYGMQCLKLSNHEFLEDGIREFKVTMDLQKAIDLMEAKSKQKAELLRKEQERLEAERLRIEAEAKAKAEAEARLAIEEANRAAQKKIEEAEAKVVAEVEKKVAEEVEKAKQEIRSNAANDTAPVSNTTTFVQRTAPVTPVPTPAPVVPPVSATAGTDKNVVTVTFRASEWPAVKKYADRIGVTYKEN